MDTREIFERLDRVFQDVFDDDTIHVTPKTTADDIEDWESGAHHADLRCRARVPHEVQDGRNLLHEERWRNGFHHRSTRKGLILPQKKMPQTTGFSRACGIFIFTVIYNGS